VDIYLLIPSFFLGINTAVYNKMALAFSSRKYKNRSRRRRQRGGDSASGMVGIDKTTGVVLPGQQSSLTGILPTTTWGSWANYPGALAWSPTTYAPPPLANGGLYTGPQSTGIWASKPFPATQYGEMVEAAKTAGNPEVFFHQRPNDNTGASFSPYVAVPLSDKHYSAEQPAQLGGRRHHSRRNNKHRRNKKLSRRHK
jgi:hypothetical protein